MINFIRKKKVLKCRSILSIRDRSTAEGRIMGLVMSLQTSSSVHKQNELQMTQMLSSAAGNGVIRSN